MRKQYRKNKRFQIYYKVYCINLGLYSEYEIFVGDKSGLGEIN